MFKQAWICGKALEELLYCHMGFILLGFGSAENSASSNLKNMVEALKCFFVIVEGFLSY